MSISHVNQTKQADDYAGLKRLFLSFCFIEYIFPVPMLVLLLMMTLVRCCCRRHQHHLKVMQIAKCVQQLQIYCSTRVSWVGNPFFQLRIRFVCIWEKNLCCFCYHYKPWTLLSWEREREVRNGKQEYKIQWQNVDYAWHGMTDWLTWLAGWWINR